MDERFIKERLFRPFYTTKGNSGMGIGAYEAREFMHTLGGDIQVESQLQMGTTFRIRIPYCTDDGVELNYRSGTS
jgi:signal transduction histidine kinase